MERMKKLKRLRSFSLIVFLLAFSFLGKAQAQADTTKVFYEDGSLKSKGLLIDGKKEGQWEVFFPNGNPNAIENYEKGELEGECKYFHPGGKLKSRQNWTKGYQEGEAEYYFENGNLYRKGKFEQGLYHGKWETYHENQSLRQKGSYNMGSPSGRWDFYDEGGIHFKSEIYPAAYYQDWDSVIQVTYYFPNGKPMMKGGMKNGKEVNTWILYKKNGKEKGRVRY